jgi:type II secretory pathway pseudopilin PulG
MIVVAIIGILSAVAIPMAAHATLRSKSAEISYMMTTFKRAIEDVYRVNSQFPPASMTAATPLGTRNPATLGTAKRNFDGFVDANWRVLTLNLQIEGATYYSYSFDGWEGGAPGAWVQAEGDVDGDGSVYSLRQTYVRDTGTYQPNGTTETNAGSF